MEEQKSTHRVEVVPVELLPHLNAETLSIVRVWGYQVVVKTAEWQDRRLRAYAPPDSVLPDTPEFAWIHGCEVGTAPPQKRRIKARRFRGEWSQGVLLPVPEGAAVGEDVAGRLGIVHYDPPEISTLTRAGAERMRRGLWPRSLKGWLYFLFVNPLRWLGLVPVTQAYREAGPDELYPKYDVDSWYRYKYLLCAGEEVVVTEKIHGSNARYVFEGGRMYCGSRTEWKRRGPNVWWQALAANLWIEEFCRANPGTALYGEVVPTQDLKYGFRSDKPGLFLFDVRRDGRWLNWDEIDAGLKRERWVPIVAAGPYCEEMISSNADGKSLVYGADHVREGVVVRPATERRDRVFGRVQMKAVSNAYLERA